MMVNIGERVIWQENGTGTKLQACDLDIKLELGTILHIIIRKMKQVVGLQKNAQPILIKLVSMES